MVGFETFGRFDHVVDARTEFFDHAVAGLAHQIGLRPHPLLPAE